LRAPVTGGATPNPRLLFNQHVPEGVPLTPGQAFKYDKSATFDIDNAPLNGGFLVKNVSVAIDPYMRLRVAPPVTGALNQPFTIGEPIVNFGVGQVLRSDDPTYKKGDLLFGYMFYESYSVRKEGDTVVPFQKIAPVPGIPTESYMTALGMPGHTGYCGWKAFIEPVEKEGATIFISSAAGAVGAFVAQLAKIKKFKVIACAGSDKKVEFLKSIGVDVVFNYKKQDTRDVLKEHGPINVYWDNTAGKTLEDAIDFIAQYGVIVSCGAIDNYNGKPYGIKNTKLIHLKSLKIFGLVYIDHLQHLQTFYQEVPALVAQGKLKMLEDIVSLDQAESRFIELQDGLNEGKTIIKFA